MLEDRKDLINLGKPSPCFRDYKHIRWVQKPNEVCFQFCNVYFSKLYSGSTHLLCSLMSSTSRSTASASGDVGIIHPRQAFVLDLGLSETSTREI